MVICEIKTKIEDLKESFENLRNLLNIKEIEKEIYKLDKEMMDPSLWDNPQKAQSIFKKAKNLKHKLNSINNIEHDFEDLEVAIELSNEDQSMFDQVDNILKEVEEKISALNMTTLLSGEYDYADAYLMIHSGAGGTESQDWVSILLRMYTKWADKNKFQIEVIDSQDGNEAGIKNATIKISGEYAYGKLRYESGIHRLVRISPFDSNNRRHTSFASVSITPEIDDNVEIEISPEELKIDTYRSGGAGGQHVNKTDSAVRITHLPTGIVVSVQNERSQHQNKTNALEILKSRLYELEQQKKTEEMIKIRGELKDNSWGNQIRSYILYPYTMVKDHRTEYETSNVQAVLDGEIDNFIKEELLFFAKYK